MTMEKIDISTETLQVGRGYWIYSDKNNVSITVAKSADPGGGGSSPVVGTPSEFEAGEESTTVSTASASAARYYADTRNDSGSSNLFDDDDAVDYRDVFNTSAPYDTFSESLFREVLSVTTDDDSDADAYEGVSEVTR